MIWVTLTFMRGDDEMLPMDVNVALITTLRDTTWYGEPATEVSMHQRSFIVKESRDEIKRLIKGMVS